MLNQLRAAGNNMTDDDFVMCVLAGLGPEYDSIVTNINSMPKSPSVSEVYGMLLSQENRTEQNLSSGAIEANYIQMRNGRRNWGNNDRSGNQYQPGIVSETLAMDLEITKEVKTLKIREKVKLWQMMTVQTQKDLVKSALRWDIQLPNAGTGSRRTL